MKDEIAGCPMMEYHIYLNDTCDADLTCDWSGTMKEMTYKKFAKLSDADKEAFARECANATEADLEEPTPAEKAKMQRVMAKLRRGRPRVGKGAKRVLVTIERDLLKDADAYAKRRGVSRAALISRGLRAVLAGAD